MVFSCFFLAANPPLGTPAMMVGTALPASVKVPINLS
jgi:hypothetical protein